MCSMVAASFGVPVLIALRQENFLAHREALQAFKVRWRLLLPAFLTCLAKACCCEGLLLPH